MTDMHSQADLYVVGALQSDEIADFTSHLTSCMQCQREVARLREATARLSQAVEAQPPSSLRASVLAQIATIPQDQPLQRGEEPSHSSSPAESVAQEQNASPAGAVVVPIGRHSTASRLSGLLAAAAVVAAVVMGGVAWQSHETARDATAAADQLAALLSATDVQTVSGNAKTGGTGTVIMSRSKGQAMFVSADLPKLPDGKVYELWTINGDPVPAGTFDTGKATIQLPDATLEAKTVAVTVEPEGGSNAPTSDAIFAVDLPT